METPSPSSDPVPLTCSGSAPESTLFQTTSFFLPYSFPVPDALDPFGSDLSEGEGINHVKKNRWIDDLINHTLKSIVPSLGCFI